MITKSILLILSVFIAVQADLLHLTVQGTISSVREVERTLSVITGITDESATNEREVNGRMAGDILQATFVIDTDFPGIQIWEGSSVTPSTTTYSRSLSLNSYLPLSIDASGFPEIHDLYLNGEHNVEIRNAKEFLSSRNPDFNNTSVNYAIGNMHTDATGFDIGMYFVNLSLSSGIDAITEGQTVWLVEGYETQHISPEGILTSHLETMESRQAEIISFSRTSSVPEPSSTSLLFAGLLFYVLFVRNKLFKVV